MRRFDPYTRTNQLIVDGMIFSFSFAAAYLIRFEGTPSWAFTKQFLIWLPYLVALRLIVNWRFGIYRFIWKYVSITDAFSIARSLSVVTVLLLALRFLYPNWAFLSARVHLPISIIAMEFLMSLVGALAARGLRRVLYERADRTSLVVPHERKRVLLYGAGRAGILLLKEFRNRGDVEVVGFVDDDTGKIGTVISGVRVQGNYEALEKVVQDLRVDEVVISIASADRKTISQILTKCEGIGVPTKIIPTLQEIIEGRVNISQVREVRIEDLLGRESVEITEFDQEVRQAYAGKRILVTGAGGSIGSELVRQLLLLKPHSMALRDKDENSTYELEQELIFRFPDARVEPQIADVRHRDRLLAIFKDFRPEVVFHAAAHKHVPLMEKHPCEAVLNNVNGTKTLLEASRDAAVERFVFISTDKAVNPTSVMGATKRVGELLVQSFADENGLRSTCVRFGNVMGSRGSIIPLFMKQIADGGPITVTHPEVVRFFMTIPEAVQLVLCAGTLGERGEVFVLDMGNPRKILDLAREMASLAGRRPGKDIEIAITGLRPGEKLSEELVGLDEAAGPTRFDKLSKLVSHSENGVAFHESVAALLLAAQENDREGVYRVLSGMGLSYNTSPRPVEDPASVE